SRAAGIQRAPISEPGLGALPDDRQDLSDLSRAPLFRGRTSGPPTRPGIVSHRRGAISVAAAVRALWAVLALGVGGCASLAANSSGSDLGLVQDAMRQVESSYVVPVGPDKLVSGALK